MTSSIFARFTSIDPKAGKYPSISPYAYTLNNPLKSIDPDGKAVEVIIGKPYSDNSYGHMAVRVQNKNTNTVFDFGRYGNTRGLFNQYGDGILNVRNGDKYISSESSIRSSVGFTFETSIDQDNAVISFFGGLLGDEGAKKLYSIDNGTGTRNKLSKDRDYHWSDNNCVTITIEALIEAGLLIFEDGTYKPTDALNQLLENQDAEKTEYKKEGEK